MKDKIYVRPTSSVYATYSRLSYKPWFALGEFVDNSTQNYFLHRDVLLRAFSRENVLTLLVQINYDWSEKTLIIIDNAHGMELDDFKRAIVLDSPPEDTTGRSEYGMGLKTAACWFGRRWSVESTMLGSSNLYRATIDVKELAQSKAETVDYEVNQIAPETHYTKITVEELNQPLRGKTISKIHDHLSSMYRQDIRSGEITIIWNGVPLRFEEAPIYEEEVNGVHKTWKDEISFDVEWDGRVLPVKGWVAIRRHGKQKDAGFVLLRRGRVIIGGPDVGYKPSEIFGQLNSFQAQRLFGELNMDSWPVTQAKDGFDWSNGLEDVFIELLQQQCKEYKYKAIDIRAPENKEVEPKEMHDQSEPVKRVLSNPEFGSWVRGELARNVVSQKQETILDEVQEDEVAIPEVSGDTDLEADVEEIPPVKQDGPIQYSLNIDNEVWRFSLYWQNQVKEAPWMGINNTSDNSIEIYLNTAHPFFAPHLGNPNMIGMLQGFVISIALAEKMATLTTFKPGYVNPVDYRTYLNKILSRIANLQSLDC